MSGGHLDAVLGARRALLVVAAPAEARAILAARDLNPAPAEAPWVLRSLTDRLDLVVCGIGKVNAAGAAARLADPTRHAGLLSLGIAGALPGAPSGLGDAIVATSSVYADEGLLTPEGFTDCAAMGFPLGPFEGSAVPCDPRWVTALEAAVSAAGLTPHRRPVATVSTCSGTDEGARAIADRTAAAAEAMEGAAVGHVAARLGLPFAELRVISNTTGNRDRQRWDLKSALSVLARVAALL
jgi:futalosine hydrolase